VKIVLEIERGIESPLELAQMVESTIQNDLARMTVQIEGKPASMTEIKTRHTRVVSFEA